MRSFLNRLLLPLTVLALCWIPTGQAAEPEPKSRDTLVYKDGDRVQGRLVGQQDSIIVFHSDRFGELRVPAADAVIIRAEKPVELASAPGGQGETKAAERAEAERLSLWEHLSPAALTAGLRNFFGPWHGRAAFSTEVVSDTADRSNLSLEGQLRRKWKADEVQLTGRYDFSRTNQLTSTDLLKGDGLWRHDFAGDRFVQYRPSFEWNRASFTKGVPSDYVLFQQEIGVGLSLVRTPARKVRVGVSENIFDVWNTTPVNTHNSRTVESAFVETELRLPWGMLLTERGVYYYSLSTRDDGWENRIELTKKFTETFSTAIRQEVRHGSPDGKQDYTRLKLLFGVDF